MSQKPVAKAYFTLSPEENPIVIECKGNKFFFEDNRIVIERQKEKGTCFYRDDLNGKLRIRQREYPYLYERLFEMLQDGGKCDLIKVKIDWQLCGEEFANMFKGKFSLLRDSQWYHNDIGKYFIIEPKIDDAFECIKENEKTEVNFFTCPITPEIIANKYILNNGVPVSVSYATTQGAILLKSNGNVNLFVDENGNILPNQDYTIFDYVVAPADFNSSTDLTDCENGIVALQLPNYNIVLYFGKCLKYWWLVEQGNVFNGDLVISAYEREEILVSELPLGEVPSPDDGWQLLPTGDKYVRCPYGVTELDNVKNGRYLNDSLIKYFKGIPCFDEFYNCIKSEFFGFTSDEVNSPLYGIFSANTPYTPYWYANKYYKNLVINQKSDVKYPNASEPAKSNLFNLTWEHIEDILNIFNLCWWVDENGCLNIEHYSYFDELIYSVKDLTTIDDKLKLHFQTAEVSDDNLPKLEEFNWMDDDLTPAFIGKPIKYSGNCTESKNNIEINIENFTTDIGAVQKNNDVADLNGDKLYPDGNNIEDEGFTLMSVNNQYLQNGNYPLSWEFLHNALFRHNRYNKEGRINDQLVNFVSTRPIFNSADYFSNNFYCENLKFFDGTWLLDCKHPLAKVSQNGEIRNAAYLGKFAIIKEANKCEIAFQLYWNCT